MVDKIDPTNMSSVEYGDALLKQRQQQVRDYEKKVQKDTKINNWLETIVTLNDIGKQRAMKNVNERIYSSDPTIAREKSEIKKYNDEYDAQAGWRKAESGVGLEAYAQQEADTYLRAGKYKNISDNLAAYQTYAPDLYNQFVRDRDLVAKYKLQQYNANKISKPILEEEYLKGIMDWRRKPLDGNLLKSAAGVFGFGKDAKANMALEDLLDPNGIKYSEELIADKKGLDELLNATNTEGQSIYNKEERELLRQAIIGVGTVAKPKVIDEIDKVQNVYNAFGTPTTSVITTVKEQTPMGEKVQIKYTSQDGTYQNVINGTVVPRGKTEVARAAEIVLQSISRNMGEENVTREQIFDKFKKDHYDLYVQAYALNAVDFPAGYSIPTISNDDKLMAGAAVRRLTESSIGTSGTGFYADFKKVYLDPEELDTNQQILYDNFINGVAESTKFYMSKGLNPEEATKAAYVEQIQGWEKLEQGGMFKSSVYNYKRQAPGSISQTSTDNESDTTTETQVTTSIPSNSTITATDGSNETFTTGTESTRANLVNQLNKNENFINTYSSSSFRIKNNMLDAVARRTDDQIRLSMEDFVDVGDSVKLDGNKGYISWNGSQFEQEGVAAVFGAVEGSNKQMTFDDIPEGPMKDLVREKAVELYATYANRVDEGIDVSDPEKLFVGSFAQEYGLLPAIAERFLGGGSPTQRAAHRNQPKLKEADSLVDIAGYSFLGITQGDAALARAFLIDAMRDAMPTEEDRTFARNRIIPSKRPV